MPDPMSDPSRLRSIGIDVAALDPAAFDDVMVFDGASTAAEIDERFRREVRAEVHAILDVFEGCDAFDVIELLRWRELPLSPEQALTDGFDGVVAVVELVTLLLLARGSRSAGDAVSGEVAPHGAIDDVHRRADRLIRLATFRIQSRARVEGSDVLGRVAADYQSFFVGVRAQQFDSIQDEHDAELFTRPRVDALLHEHLGFTYGDFVAVRDAIAHVYSAALNSGPDLVVDIISRSEQEGRELTAGEREAVAAAVEDLVLLPGARASFTAADLATVSGVDLGAVDAVLDAFSIGFKETDPVEAAVRFLRGDNPLATTSLVRSGDRYVRTCGRIGSDSFRSIAEAAFKETPNWEPYLKARTAVSEQLAVAAIERVLSVEPHWVDGHYFAPKKTAGPSDLGSSCDDLDAVGHDTDSDALFVIGDVAICVEVKGRTIAEAARRGGTVRLRREFNKVFGEGTDQARRLETLIRTNGGVWQADRTWLDLSYVKEIRTVVIGLDSFGPLSIALGDLAESSFLGAGSLPWLASLHDLEVVSRVLDRPSEFLLYLRRRTDSGVAFLFRAFDELDLFALFLQGGMYVEVDPDEVHRLHPVTPAPTEDARARFAEDAQPTVVGTHTQQLDAWMYWAQGSSPSEAPKPGFVGDPAGLGIVDFLNETRSPGWFRFGADILGLSHAAQRAIGLTVGQLLDRSADDGLPHSVVFTYPGLWGYPLLFVETSPDGATDDVVEHLVAYMEVKKHQQRADRALGLIVNGDGRIVAAIYMNEPPTVNPEMDEAADRFLAQPGNDPTSP